MTGPHPPLQIEESDADGVLRLSLTGELDRWSAPILEDRLARVRAEKSPVRLNLARVQLIDNMGIRLLIQSVGDARIKGWQFHIERDLAPQVQSVFRLVRLDRFVDSCHQEALAQAHL
jgi:anti-anti-sigma factor